MKGGLFARLALTNIRKNRKIYAPYIFACVGTVMMFYIIGKLEKVTSRKLISTVKLVFH